MVFVSASSLSLPPSLRKSSSSMCCPDLTIFVFGFCVFTQQNTQSTKELVFIAVCVWPAYARAAQTFFFSKSLVFVLVLVGVHVRYILFLALVHLQQDDYADNADERVANEDGEAGGFANEHADGEGFADEDADGEGVTGADFKHKD